MSWRTIALGALLAGGAVLGTARWALPFRTLPPTGPHPVHTESWVVLDADRVDPFADDPVPRRFPAQVWRPADLFSAGPLVVFLHGVKGRRSAYATWLAELASHGYVVVAADHPPIALAPSFPERPGAPSSALWQELMGTARNPTTFVNHPTFRLAHEVVEADVQALIRDVQTRFSVSADRVLLAGHSFGGSVASTMCGRLPECVAVVNLDGPTFTEPHGPVVEVPLLVVAAGRTRTSEALNRVWHPLDALIDRAQGPVYVVDLPDAGHLQLSDMGLLVRPALVRWAMSEVHMGPSSVDGVLRAVGDVMVAFADRHLRQDPQADPAQAAQGHAVLQLR